MGSHGDALAWFDLAPGHGVLELHGLITAPGPALELHVEVIGAATETEDGEWIGSLEVGLSLSAGGLSHARLPDSGNSWADPTLFAPPLEVPRPQSQSARIFSRSLSRMTPANAGCLARFRRDRLLCRGALHGARGPEHRASSGRTLGGGIIGAT